MAPVYGPQSMAHASDNAVSHTMATGEGHGTAAVEALKRAATGSAFKSVVVDKVRPSVAHPLATLQRPI